MPRQPATDAAGPAPLGRLLRRGDFLAAARRGAKAVTPGLVLQALPRPATDTTGGAQIRFGLTASRKVGGAVQRNRARRRLRALALEMLPVGGRPGTDYVLIARSGTLDRSFAELRADLARALGRVARPPVRPDRAKAQPEPQDRGHECGP